MPSKQIVVETRSTGTVMTSYTVQTCNQLVCRLNEQRAWLRACVFWLSPGSFEDASRMVCRRSGLMHAATRTFLRCCEMYSIYLHRQNRCSCRILFQQMRILNRYFLNGCKTTCSKMMTKKPFHYAETTFAVNIKHYWRNARVSYTACTNMVSCTQVPERVSFLQLTYNATSRVPLLRIGRSSISISVKSRY